MAFQYDQNRGLKTLEEIKRKHGITTAGESSASPEFTAYMKRYAKRKEEEEKAKKAKKAASSSKSNSKSQDKSKTSSKPKKEEGFFDKVGQDLGDAFKNTKDFFTKDVPSAAKAAGQFFNPFDDVSMGEATKNFLDKGSKSKSMQEVARGSNRVLDSFTATTLSNLDKKVNNREPNYKNTRKIGEGGTIDYLTSGLGYLAPGMAVAKGLQATKLGSKLATKAGDNLATKIGKKGVEGAITGGVLGTVEEGIGGSINPQDFNLGNSLQRIGTDALFGLVADPALHGLGKGVIKGAQGLGKATRAITGKTPSSSLSNAADEASQGFNFETQPFTKGTYNGQNIVGNPSNTFRLNAPESQSTTLGLNGSRSSGMLENPTLGLNEPLYTGKPKAKLGQEVKIDGTPLLNEPSALSNPLFKELNDAVENQYNYLKESFANRKGVNIGTTSNGLDGNYREVTGRYGFSENPGWYQDFYAENKRPPTDKDLRKMAVDHVVNGFSDETGELPPWSPQAMQNIDNQLDELYTLVDEVADAGEREGISELITALEKEKEQLLDLSEDLINKVEKDKSLKKDMSEGKEDLSYNTSENIEKPLKFKKELVGKNEPVSYVGQMDPKDAVALRAEGNYTTRPSNDGIKMDVQPGEVAPELQDYVFKRKEKPLKFKQTVEQTRAEMKQGQDFVDAEFEDLNNGDPVKEEQINNAASSPKEQALSNIDTLLENPENTAAYIQSLENEKSTLANMLEAGAISEREHDAYIRAIDARIQEVDATLGKGQQVKTEEGPISSSATEETKSFKSENPVPKEQNERGFINTLKNSEKTSQSLKERLADAYTPLSNEEVVQRANKRVSDDIETSVRYVKNARKLTAEHVTTAHRLIDEFQKSGNIERAVEIAEHIAEAGTRAGQSIQAFSIYNRLSPEGILVHAQRIVNKVNQKVGALGEKQKITQETAAKLTDLASTVQHMTGTKEVANDVMNIMNKAKKGNVLTDDEMKTLWSFVTDAKQFVKDLSSKEKPVKPKAVKDKRTRDSVVDFMSKQEELAKKRLAKRRNRALAGIPVDDFYDYAVIGASKVAKGVVKFSDFAEEMTKEFGEDIRPYMQQIYDKAVETFNLQTDRISSRRLSEVEKITNKALKGAKIDEQEAALIHEMARKVAGLSGDAKTEASQELQATLMILERPTIGQKISTAQTIAQLLNPKTTVRNALGNEMFYRLERLNKYVATPIDIARVQLFGGKRSVTFRTNNQGKYWENWIKGAKAGWKGVNPEGLATQYDLRPNAFKSKLNPLTYLEKTLGATLQSFDYASYRRAVNKTLGEMATLRAMNEGLKGTAKKEAIQKYIREADDNVFQIADAYGKYVTMQDNTFLATGLQRFKNALNFGKDFGFGDIIIKYPRTPANLLMRAMDYSPVGFLRSAKLLADPLWKKEKFDPSEFALSLSRAAIGTGGLTGLGLFLADKGILSGSGDKDWDVNQLEQMAGKRQYSVNVDALKRFVFSGFDEKETKAKKGDQYISYDWAQPLSIALSVGANINKSVKEEGELDLGKTAYASLEGATGTMLEQSVLQGVKKAFETYPNMTVMDKVTDLLGEVPASFVPTASNQIRQFTDNTTRSTYDPDKTKASMNKATNRIPGLEKVLPKTYDTLGKQKEVFQGDSNNLFNVFLNPSFVSQYKPSKEAKFVLDTIEATGNKQAAPRSAQKTITVDGESVKLSAKQYSKYQKLLGTETKKGIKNMMEDYEGKKNYKEISEALDNVLDRAGKRARNKLKEDM